MTPNVDQANSLRDLRLDKLVGLKELRLRNMFLEDLEPFSSIKRLEILQVQDCTQLQSLNGIGGMRDLKVLEFGGFEFKVKDAVTLRKLEKLETVRIEVSDAFSVRENWEALFDKPELKRLTIQCHWKSRGAYEKQTVVSHDHAEPSKPGSDEFVPCPNLDYLSLWEVDPEVENLQFCKEMPKLTTLKIKGANKLKSLDGIQYCKNLKNLVISQCVNLQSVEGIQHLEELEQLVIEDSEAVIEFPTLNCAGLGTLSLRRMNGFDDLEFLKRLPQLTILDLRYSSIKSLKGLEHLKSLEELMCSWSQLEEIGCGRVEVAIEELDFKNCVKLKNLDGLEHFTNLHAIGLNGCQNIESVAAMGNLQSLRRLDLIGCKALKTLQGLREVPQLGHVYVDGCTELSDISSLLKVEELKAFDWSNCPKLKVEQVESLLRKHPKLDEWPEVTKP